MARYEHLKIYKSAFDLALYFEKICRGLSRYNKYTLGTELRDLTRELLKLIINANNVENKRAVLLNIREKLGELKIILRMCKEVKAFNNFQSFEYSIKCVVDISRQNEGWLRSSR